MQSPFQKRERNWTKLTFTKISGTVIGDKKKIGQWVTDTSPVTTPETIAGRISAPVPFSLRKWRLSACRLDVQLTLARRYGNFFHSFIGCSSSDIQYKFVIQHTHKKKRRRSKNPKGVGATGLTSVQPDIACENSRHLATLVSPPNDVRETSAEIPY